MTVEWVCIVTNDGYEVLLHRLAAMQSGFLKELILVAADPLFNASGSATASGTVRVVVDAELPVLEMACRFLCFKARKGQPILDFPPFRQLDMSRRSDRKFVINVLVLANYLDC